MRISYVNMYLVFKYGTSPQSEEIRYTITYLRTQYTGDRSELINLTLLFG